MCDSDDCSSHVAWGHFGGVLVQLLHLAIVEVCVQTFAVKIAAVPNTHARRCLLKVREIL